MDHLLARRGAARIALIPGEVLEALNTGQVPTVNLHDFLALDLPRLARNVARQVGLDPGAERLEDTLAMLPAFAPVKRDLHIARASCDLAEPRADASRYVQNSVANWLNEAAKTQPAWVREVCAEWSGGRPPPETAYIVRRAQRSLREED